MLFRLKLKLRIIPITNSFSSDSIYSAVDSNDIAHVFIDIYSGHDFRTTGFDNDLNLAYDVASSGWSSNHYTTDFGLDNSGSIYITGYHAAKFMSRSASLLIQSDGDTNWNTVPTWESGQVALHLSNHRLYRFWGDFDHEINYNSPSEGTSHSSGVIGNYGGNIPYYRLNDSAGNLNNAALPCGLYFNTGTWPDYRYTYQRLYRHCK